MLFSQAGRDDTDDFFAKIVLPIHMNNQQHSVPTWLDLSQANIASDRRERIFKASLWNPQNG